MSGYVLVVDDNPEVQMLVRDALQLLGTESRQAANGQQALAMITDEPPTAIILDLMMPIMDGFTMLTHLQHDPKNRAIPVILLSGLVDEAGRTSGLPGVIGVIRKDQFSVAGLRGLLVKAGCIREPDLSRSPDS